MQGEKITLQNLFDEMMAIDSLQKKDIRKKLADAKKRMEALQRNYPKRVKEIQDDAFAECSSLKMVTFYGFEQPTICSTTTFENS